jgi:BirA family transcriptional regulator, biotin operon repressor / biotin---[acetyl-CoA-carboxylase] ligase
MIARRNREGRPMDRPLRIDEIQRGLNTKRLGKKIYYLSEITSTNTHARARAEQGGAEGETVIAEKQTEGRGRMGRNWVSPPYANLYLSVILRPRLAPARAPQITLMAAVALAETVESLIGRPPEIKWPNDILVDGKKLAGILTESSCQAERVLFVILGIGINVNYSVELMPEDIRARATSLMLLKKKLVSREELVRRLLRNLDRCYGDLEESGFGALSRRWDAYFGLKGKKVIVEMADRSVMGKAVGIDNDGTLLLEDEKNALHRVIAGDVIAAEG